MPGSVEQVKLTESALLSALAEVDGCGSVLVVGEDCATQARRILSTCDPQGKPIGIMHGRLKVHVDPERTGWEIF